MQRIFKEMAMTDQKISVEGTEKNQKYWVILEAKIWSGDCHIRSRVSNNSSAMLRTSDEFFLCMDINYKQVRIHNFQNLSAASFFATIYLNQIILVLSRNSVSCIVRVRWFSGVWTPSVFCLPRRHKYIVYRATFILAVMRLRLTRDANFATK
jgi:hypothetical protein